MSGPDVRNLVMRPSPIVRVTRSADGIVFMHVKQGCIFSANRTAARIWEAIVAGQHPSEIASQMAIEFSVDQATVQSDIQEFVSALLAREILLSE